MSQEAEAPETTTVEASTAAVATVAATEAVVDEAMAIIMAIIMVAVELIGTTEAASRAHHLSSLLHPAHLTTRVEMEARAQAERWYPLRRE
jgi:hypothetical protein